MAKKKEKKETAEEYQTRRGEEREAAARADS